MDLAASRPLESLKWRFEYCITDRVDAAGSPLRTWRLYIEGVTTTELLTMKEAEIAVPREHPCWEKLRWLFSDTHERLVLLPYEPFIPCRFLINALGQGFIDRVLAMSHERKVWSSTTGWTWLHIPGDDAR